MKNRWKESYYNFIYDNLLEDLDKKVIYNTRTGALAVLEKDNAKMLKDFLENGIEIPDKGFLQKLVACGFLISDNFDENKDIEVSNYRGKFDSSKMALTIAPTMACNFRCIYCFEKGQYENQVMSDKTMESIIKYITEHAKHLQVLDITWYGGEPLLAMKQMEKLARQILNITEQYKIQYSSSIVTNGYLLNIETVKRLKEIGIKDIQITIDGTQEVHDARRPLANGNGTFDTIMKNLTEIKGILPIYIRINIDKENCNGIKEIVSLFKANDLLDSIILYLGLVTPSNGKYEGSKCMAAESYSVFNLKFMQDNNIPLTNIYPMPKSNYCAADHYYSYVVDPLGKLYKCWSDIGIPDRVVGDITDNIYTELNYERLNEFILYNPTKDERCKSCKHLPICMGGCPYHRISNFKICDRHKYDLDLYMKQCVKILLKGERK